MCGHLRTAGWRPHPCACSFHQSPLVSGQQVILHGLDQVVFTCAAVLYQRLLLHPLNTAREEELVRGGILIISLIQHEPLKVVLKKR